MAGNDHMKDQAAISLELSERDRKFLMEVFTMARDGAREELRKHGRRLRNTAGVRREQATYERLLTALGQGRLDPDPELLAVLRELAEVVDESNEYRRVVAEHEALRALIAPLERRRGSCAGRSPGCAAIRCRGDNGTCRR